MGQMLQRDGSFLQLVPLSLLHILCLLMSSELLRKHGSAADFLRPTQNETHKSSGNLSCAKHHGEKSPESTGWKGAV
uniref:Uncharacterized protein n=1 Tax=Knipowitschia caucasica TaxID=637954 RepID=A0AAV2JG46_KNICA